tara:strand:+ start:271 stop:1188 length:918 start_codon:yes stop_codon:yes gene_type:complete
MTTEFDMISEKKPDLSAKTLTNYRNVYKRLRTLFKDEDIATLGNAEIIKGIDDYEGTPAVKQTLLNVAIVLKQVFDLNVKPLIEKRTQLIKDIKNHTVEVTNKELSDSLPTYKELVTFRDNLFKDGKFSDYVINYLLMTGVRNKDVNAIITRSDKNLKENTNYLILNKSSVKYIRDDYKTKEKYDTKKETIKDKKLVESLNYILGDKEELPLLNTGNDSQIAETSLNKFISNRTLNKIGQGAIFKVMVNGQPKKREKLGAVRGTNLQTVMEHYDINFKNEAAKLEPKKRGRKPKAKPEEPKEESN